VKRARDGVGAFPVAVDRGAVAGLAGLLALTLAWAACTGAFYEWGGAGARGVKELKDKRHREAASSLREARKELPNSATVRYDEGLALARAGLADSARDVYREALDGFELRGDVARASAAYNLGNEALAAGKLGQAQQYYRESLRIDPKRIDVKRNLEEAIRRSRKLRPPQSGGGAGGSGGGPPAPGSGQRPPGHGSSNPGAPPKPDEGQGSQKPERQDLSGETPSRAEAEHWLDALEAERKAARLRDRKEQKEGSNAKDW
jgi:tetratricopeptide (TPR) repeat protein